MPETDTTDHSDPRTRTQTVSFMAPLLPGKATADREAMNSCWTGDRRNEHANSRRRHDASRPDPGLQRLSLPAAGHGPPCPPTTGPTH